MTINEINFWINVAYIGLSALSTLAILLIPVWMLLRLFRFLITHSHRFSDSTLVRIFSLGAAILVLPDVIPAVLKALWSFFYALLTEAPTSLTATWQTGNVDCVPNETIGQCIGDLSFLFMQTWVSVFANAFDREMTFPITKVILFLALWFLVSRLFDHLYQSHQSRIEKSRGMIWLQSLFTRLRAIKINPTTISNLKFYLILGLGGYLSLASIAAIPGLQEKTAAFQEVSSDNMRIYLEGALTQFEVKYSTDVGPGNPLSALNDFIKDVTAEDIFEDPVEKEPVTVAQRSPDDDVVSDTAPASPGETALEPGHDDISADAAENTPPEKRLSAAQLENLKQIISEAERDRNQFQHDWTNLVTSATAQLTIIKERAIRTYSVANLGRTGNREKAKHYLDITEWFDDQLIAYDELLYKCQVTGKEANRALQQWSEDTVASLRDNPSAKLLNSPPSLRKQAQSDCQISGITSDPVPDRPKLGSYFGGPFGFATSWLLETESLPLVLITGMLGFGLLGAASSTFIRERAQNIGGPLVNDLTGVVIRGVSAAVVVFLAVEGGLAIFSVGDNEPNPYVLLLTCLVAAVFSETVWQWAQNRLRNSFPPDAGETVEAT